VTSLDPASPFAMLPLQNSEGTAYLDASAPGTYGAVWTATAGDTWCGSTAAFQ
jgi:hypothetical protein